MIRRPPRSTPLYSSAASDVYKRQVYGPWGRPDMALFKFTKAVVNDETIDVYNHGNMMRDFTYVDDIVEAISRLIQKPAQPNPEWSGANPDPSSSYAPYLSLIHISEPTRPY